jgi:hypothetical protein
MTTAQRILTLSAGHVHPADLKLLKSPEPPILCATFISAPDHGFVVWVDEDIAEKGSTEKHHTGWTSSFRKLLAYCEERGAAWVKLDIESGDVTDELTLFTPAE